MKALKEKRLSLRSFLRRGLVILSLFALAFVSCADSGDGDTDTTPPITENRPKVTSIEVVSGPSGHWFQGLEPDMTGMSIRVMWEGNPELQTYGVDEMKEKGFSISPNYCDEPGAYPYAGDFYVVHRDSPNQQSEAIPYKGVVWLLSVGGFTLDEMFADQVIDSKTTGKSLTASYVYSETSPYTDPTTITQGTPTRTATGTIPINSAYPPKAYYDYTGLAGDKSGLAGTTAKYFEVVIGAIKTKNGTLGTPVHLAKARVNITKYWQVVEVKLGTPPDTFWAFDDEVELSVKTALGGINTALEAKLSGVTFDIRYQYKYTEEPKTENIPYATFKKRVGDARTVLRTIDPTYSALENWTNDGIKKAGEETVSSGYNGADYDILRYDEDQTVEEGTYRGAPTWGFSLDYVPLQYLQTVSGNTAAYVARVDVRLPIATFQNEISVERRYGLNNARLAFQRDPLAMSPDQFQMVVERWQLLGQYQVGSVKQSKYIALSSSMFHYGFTSAGTAISLNPKGEISNTAFASIASYSSLTYRDFPLPIRYRAERLADETETVVVDIFRLGQPYGTKDD